MGGSYREGIPHKQAVALTRRHPRNGARCDYHVESHRHPCCGGPGAERPTRPRSCAEGTHRTDRARFVGRRTRRGCSPRGRPVRAGDAERRHRVGAVRVRAGLGDAGCALGAVHRSAAAMGVRSCAADGRERSSPGAVRLPGADGSQLDLASRDAGVVDLDDRARSPEPSRLPRPLGAVPGDCGAGSRLGRRRLPDRSATLRPRRRTPCLGS